MTVVAATGHRPPKLGGYTPQVRYALGGLAVEWLRTVRPETVICGMALGWDQAVAAACVALEIPFIAAVPFAGQELRWPPGAQERYRRILAQASEVEVLTSEQLFGKQVDKALQARNEWMVDHADEMLALWDGTWGGTFNCIEYAKKVGRPVHNLWLRWTLDDEAWGLLG